MAAIVMHAPAGDKAGIQQAKQCLEHLYYEKAKTVDPFEQEIYTMDTAVSSFRMDDPVSRPTPYGHEKTFFYNLKVPPKDTSREAPFVEVYSKSLWMYPEAGDSAALLVSDMLTNQKKKGFERWSDEHEWKGKVNGLTVYHVEIYGHYKSDGSIIPKIERSSYDKEKTLIYLYILFPGDRTAVILKGMAFEDYQKWLAEFKKLAATIRKK